MHAPRLVKLQVRALAAGLLIAMPLWAHAINLGAIGPVYPIREQDWLDHVKQRLGEMERSGELARLQREQADRQIGAIRNPAPVPGLVTGPLARTSYIDPSITLSKDLLDQNGRVLFPAGTSTNPLDVVTMTRKLLFFDARDPRQLERAHLLVMQHGTGIKPVLVGGSYLELMRHWKIKVYFDQRGALVERFKIRQVPALVYQENKRLRVDELGTAP